ncbi:MAG: MFS transporter, partial [Acidimicrobiales bacterium]
PPVPEEVLDHEILAIERALSDHGPTERRELSRMVGGELWGPGVFAEVLRRALAEGSIRRLSRRIYASASDRDGPDGEEGA